MRSFLSVCLLFACAAPQIASGWKYENLLHRPLNFTCPDGEYIDTIFSAHINKNWKEDRKWKFNCTSPESKTVNAKCTQSKDFENEPKEVLKFSCPANSVISGIYSKFDSYVGTLYRYFDRQYKFTCCDLNGVSPKKCYWNVANKLDEEMYVKLDKNSVIRGMYGKYDWFTNDRVYRFEICEMV